LFTLFPVKNAVYYSGLSREATKWLGIESLLKKWDFS